MGAEGDVILKVSLRAGDIDSAVKEIKKAVEKAFEGREDAVDLDDTLQSMIEHINELITSIKDLTEAVSKMNEAQREAGESGSDLSDVFIKLLDVFGRIGGEAVGALNRLGGVAGNILSSIGRGLQSITSRLGSMRGLLGRVLNGFRGMVGSIRGGFASTNNTITESIKRLMRFQVIFAMVRRLFNRIRSLSTEGLNNLAHYSNEFNKTMSVFTTDLQWMRNALAAAVSPLVNIIAPIFDRIATAIAEALNMVSKFFATVTGQKTYYKAIKQQKDYAKAVEGANQALEEQLGAYDNLLVIDQQTGMGGNSNTPNYGGMFETLPVDNEFADILEMWENADFTELGRRFGEKINEALESIPWDEIKKTAAKIGKSIATFINGAVEEINWELVGVTLAEALNTIVILFDEFVSNLHFDSIGTAIGEAINGFLDMVDWNRIFHLADTLGRGMAKLINAFNVTTDFEKVGESLANVFNTIVTAIHGFVDELNFSNVGQALGNAINGFFENFDFKKLSHAITTWINGLGKFVSSLITTTAWEMIGRKIGQTIADILIGIDFNLWADNFSGFVNSIISFIAGLIKPLDGKWELIGEKIRKGIFKAITGIDFKNVITTTFHLLEGLVEFIAGLLDATDEEWNELSTTIANGISEGINSISWENMRVAVTKIKNGIFNGLKAGIKAISVILLGEEVGGKFADSSGALLEGLKTMLDTTEIEEIFNGVFGIIQTAFDNVISPIITALTESIDWESIGSTITNAVTTVSDKIEDFLEAAQPFIEWFANTALPVIINLAGEITKITFRALLYGLDSITQKLKDVYALIKDIKNMLPGGNGSSKKKDLASTLDGIADISVDAGLLGLGLWEDLAVGLDLAAEGAQNLFKAAAELFGVDTSKWESLLPTVQDIQKTFNGLRLDFNAFKDDIFVVNKTFNADGNLSEFVAVMDGMTYTFDLVNGKIVDSYGFVAEWNGNLSDARQALIDAKNAAVESGEGIGQVGEVMKTSSDALHESIDSIYEFTGVFGIIKQNNPELQTHFKHWNDINALYKDFIDSGAPDMHQWLDQLGIDYGSLNLGIEAVATGNENLVSTSNNVTSSIKEEKGVVDDLSVTYKDTTMSLADFLNELGETQVPGKNSTWTFQQLHDQIEKVRHGVVDSIDDFEDFADALILAGVDVREFTDVELANMYAEFINTPDLSGTGSDMVQGFIDGIKAKEEELKSEMDVVSGVPNSKLRSILQIESPSKVMKTNGEYVVEGLISGIQAKLTELENQIGELPGKIRDRLGTADKILYTEGMQMMKGMATAVEKSVYLITDIMHSLPNRIVAALGDLTYIGVNAATQIANGFRRVHIPVPVYNVGTKVSSAAGVPVQLPNVSVQWLAQGAVLPPNQPFLAMVGDQQSGTNVEAPLETIKQALSEVLGGSGSGVREPIILQVDGKTVASVVWSEEDKKYKQYGAYAPSF